MRWKIGHGSEGHEPHGHDRGYGGHDPRQIDLVTIIALLIVIVAAFRFYNSNANAPSTSAFIVPSQSVRW